MKHVFDNIGDSSGAEEIERLGFEDKLQDSRRRQQKQSSR